MFPEHVFRFLCLLPLCPCTCVPGRPQCLGPGQGKLELYCSAVIQMPPASSISSLFSVLMLQSSSALSTVTPKQLLDSFTFIVTCQPTGPQNICHRLILIDVGFCSKWHLCKTAQRSSYRIHYSFE